MSNENDTLSDFEISTNLKIMITVIGFIIGLVTIILNVVAILAISKIRGSLPVNIRLVCCLVASDLLVSFIVVFETLNSFIFHYVGNNVFHNVWATKGSINDGLLPSYHPCFSLILHVLRYTAYNGTLLSLTALAADLYIAIMYPMNYTSYMRKDRVNFLIVFIFVIAFMFGSSVLYIPVFKDYQNHSTMLNTDYCFVRWHQHMKASFVTFGVIVLSIIVVTLVYVTVFYEIRNFHNNAARCPRQPYRYAVTVSATNSAETVNNNHHQQDVTRGSNNMKRNQRGLTTTLVLLLVFLFCFSPSFINELYLIIGTQNRLHEYKYVIKLAQLLMNLPLICSALDPLLYSYRLKDIKLSYQKLFCCYNDDIKAIIPPLVAGRARPHPTVQIYFPQRRRSIAGANPSMTIQYSSPWSERIARATGLYMERIRKFSSTQLNLDAKFRKRTRNSADSKDTDQNRQILLEKYAGHAKSCFTAPNKFPIKSSHFISAPKMVLCPWQFANRSLKNSWLKDDTSESSSRPEKALIALQRSQRLSTYSSTECGHSGSIDSGNTNSTSVFNSFHLQRSKSIDNSSLRYTSIEKKPIQIEKMIIESD